VATSDIKRRIAKAEQGTAGKGTDLHILGLIKAGVYYDELTDEEKKQYAQHWKTDRETLETVRGDLLNNGSLHFRLERLIPPRSRKEYEDRLKEVQGIMDEIAAEYNSPEQREKRRREYEEQTGNKAPEWM
jgi:hypothetical protein